MQPSSAAPSPWRKWDLVLVLVGGTVNNVGDWMLAVALPVYVRPRRRAIAAAAA